MLFPCEYPQNVSGIVLIEVTIPNNLGTRNEYFVYFAQQNFKRKYRPNYNSLWQNILDKFTKDFLSFLRLWSHLLKKSLTENVIFCVVIGFSRECFTADLSLFPRTTVKYFRSGRLARYFSSIPRFSGVFLNFPNFLDPKS